jgi:two-component system, NtrC family, response regulator AtoC
MGVRIQTAMIIDDDIDLTYLLSTILEARKIHVLVVHTLDEAEEYLSYLKPTIIFLDNSFPEGLGVNFIKSIKSVDDEIKIVMMTADRSTWIEQKARSEGINDFVKKPFSKEIIHTTLDRLDVHKS